jgi:SAM-dependent methyltransferase
MQEFGPKATGPGASDAIEILSVSLLQEEKETASRIEKLAQDLRIGLGWHYLLDLTWILARLTPDPVGPVMDAGAGTGIIQWYLCERGRRVLSVDRASRRHLPIRLRSRYRVRGLREEDLEPLPGAIVRELFLHGPPPKAIARQVRNLVERSLRVVRRQGEVVLYNQDLRNLADVPDGSVDTVVAVSSLEHNEPHDLELVVEELLRVLRPGGQLIATLGAARAEDWFHTPSRGWCYTEQTLRRVFGIGPSVMTNYDQFDALFQRLRDSEQLRRNLADFYYRSGENGMPWGVWDPLYQPVGIRKVKPAAQDGL